MSHAYVINRQLYHSLLLDVGMVECAEEWFVDRAVDGVRNEFTKSERFMVKRAADALEMLCNADPNSFEDYAELVEEAIALHVQFLKLNRSIFHLLQRGTGSDFQMDRMDAAHAFSVNIGLMFADARHYAENTEVPANGDTNMLHWTLLTKIADARDYALSQRLALRDMLADVDGMRMFNPAYSHNLPGID